MRKEKPNSGTATENPDTRLPEVVLAVLTSGSDEDAALNISTLMGHLRVAELLLEAGAAASARTRWGVTPLICAALGRHVALAQLLLRNDANTEESTRGHFYEHKYTPLHIASSVGHFELVTLLLECGANVNALSSHRSTPLILATMCGLQKYLKYNVYGFFEFFGRDSETDSYTSLLSGHHEVAKRLIEEGAQVNACSAKGYSPLLCAAGVGKMETVLLLLENGAQVAPHEDFPTALHFASLGGHRGVATLLLEKGIEVDARDVARRTPLMWAAKGGSTDTVSLLLQQGADVLACDEYTFTALHFASNEGHYDIAHLLLQKGADVNALSGEGDSPLMMAVGPRSVETEIFFQRGALHYASCKGNLNVVKLLLQNGADVNAMNSIGCSPLMMSAASGCLDTTVFLLEKGADISARNISNYTASHYASFHGQHDISQLLLQKSIHQSS